jgi:hypothetical protein
MSEETISIHERAQQCVLDTLCETDQAVCVSFFETLGEHLMALEGEDGDLPEGVVLVIYDSQETYETYASDMLEVVPKAESYNNILDVLRDLLIQENMPTGIFSLIPESYQEFMQQEGYENTSDLHSEWAGQHFEEDMAALIDAHHQDTGLWWTEDDAGFLSLSSNPKDPEKTLVHTSVPSPGTLCEALTRGEYAVLRAVSACSDEEFHTWLKGSEGQQMIQNFCQALEFEQVGNDEASI